MVHGFVILFAAMADSQPSARAAGPGTVRLALELLERTAGRRRRCRRCRSVIAENARKRGQAWSVCTPCAQAIEDETRQLEIEPALIRRCLVCRTDIAQLRAGARTLRRRLQKRALAAVAQPAPPGTLIRGGSRWPNLPRSAAIRPSRAGPPTRTFSTRRRTKSPRSSPALSTPTRGRRRATHWRARRSGTRLAHRSTAATAARAGGGSLTSPSCTWTRRSSCLTSRAGRRERMPELPDTTYFTLAPDWVCEVLSSSTRKVDLHEKRPVYAREGVAHLWLVDPTDRTLEAFELRDSQWVLIATAADEDSISIRPFDAITFSLGDLWR